MFPRAARRRAGRGRSRRAPRPSRRRTAGRRRRTRAGRRRRRQRDLRFGGEAAHRGSHVAALLQQPDDAPGGDISGPPGHQHGLVHRVSRSSTVRNQWSLNTITAQRSVTLANMDFQRARRPDRSPSGGRRSFRWRANCWPSSGSPRSACASSAAASGWPSPTCCATSRAARRSSWRCSTRNGGSGWTSSSSAWRPAAADARFAVELEVARTLADTLADHPLLCELLSSLAGVLEHNISVEYAREFKTKASANAVRLRDGAGAHPEPRRGRRLHFAGAVTSSRADCGATSGPRPTSRR